MASVIVLNSKSRCCVRGFDDSTTGAEAGTTGVAVGSEGGAAVLEVDLSLRVAFIVAFTLWWRRPCAASQASHLCVRM